MFEIIVIVYLLLLIFLLWASIWSLFSVFIHRWTTWEKWIIFWRSHCPKCWTTLKAIDLIPVLSYLMIKWKCRTCKNQIPKFYFYLEVYFWILTTCYFIIQYMYNTYITTFIFFIIFYISYKIFKIYYIKTQLC